jgi:hypothetical protein
VGMLAVVPVLSWACAHAFSRWFRACALASARRHAMCRVLRDNVLQISLINAIALPSHYSAPSGGSISAGAQSLIELHIHHLQSVRK